jgi:hypothetical protein
MDLIKIEEVTGAELTAGEYLDILPEFYQLKTVVENNPWHDHQTVFDHVIKVYMELEKLLVKVDMSPERKRLLRIATLLHDIAKPDTLVTDKAGMARCPGHELMGASRVKNFAGRFGLNESETKTVEKIVLYHGFISDMITLSMTNGKVNKYRKIFREVVGEVAEELLLLMHADLLGSDLAKTQPLEFRNRIELVGEL